MTRRRWHVAVACLLIVAGCGDDAASPPSARPLSDEQASRLANVLFDNLDGKGATFEVNARAADGMTVNLRGEVDWVDHFGHGTVSASGVEADLAEVYWSADEVLERRPGLNRQLLDQENKTVVFVARPAQPAGRALDRLLGIVTALAGPQRDNPLLIKQKSGSAFLRTDELRGVKVDVMRFGDHNVYWLDQQAGLLMRFEDTGQVGGQPVVVDVLSRGPQQIPNPPAELVVRVADIGAAYPFPQP